MLGADYDESVGLRCLEWRGRLLFCKLLCDRLGWSRRHHAMGRSVATMRWVHPPLRWVPPRIVGMPPWHRAIGLLLGTISSRNFSLGGTRQTVLAKPNFPPAAQGLAIHATTSIRIIDVGLHVTEHIIRAIEWHNGVPPQRARRQEGPHGPSTQQ